VFQNFILQRGRFPVPESAADPRTHNRAANHWCRWKDEQQHPQRIRYPWIDTRSRPETGRHDTPTDAPTTDPSHSAPETRPVASTEPPITAPATAPPSVHKGRTANPINPQNESADVPLHRDPVKKIAVAAPASAPTAPAAVIWNARLDFGFPGSSGISQSAISEY
jgi:hypothetical protein